eukprot:GHVL01022533.1.p1 GENE.GHVL01022533.1~~GHVL01022533.1.p1  ORF type:complete len:306 (+),score=86.11 GHVL01022533.1:69-920(+)
MLTTFDPKKNVYISKNNIDLADITSNRILEQKQLLCHVSKQFQQIVNCSQRENEDIKNISISVGDIMKLNTDVNNASQNIVNYLSERQEKYKMNESKYDYLNGFTISKLPEKDREELFITISRAQRRSNVNRTSGITSINNDITRECIPKYISFIIPKDVHVHTTVGFPAHSCYELSKQINQVSDVQRAQILDVDNIIDNIKNIRNDFCKEKKQCIELCDEWLKHKNDYENINKRICQLEGNEESLIGMNITELEDLSINISRIMLNITVEKTVRKARSQVRE